MADDQLMSVIQRMHDAGEDEESIKSVIEFYNSKPKAPSAAEKFSQLPMDEQRKQSAANMHAQDSAVEGYEGKRIADTIDDSMYGLVSGIKRAPMDLLKGAGNLLLSLPGAVSGLAKSAQDPRQSAINAADALNAAPGAMVKFADEKLKQASADPHEFGAEIGSNIGQTAMLAGAPTAAASSLPGVRLAGKGLESFGEKISFPMMISGSHQLLSGNPAGIPMMLAPAAVKAVGGKMSTAGMNDEALAGAHATKVKVATTKASAGVPLSKADKKVMSAERARVKAVPKVEEAPIEKPSDATFKFSEDVRSNLTKDLNKLPDARSGLDDLDAGIESASKQMAGKRQQNASAQRTDTAQEQRADADWYKKQQLEETPALSPIEQHMLDLAEGKSSGAVASIPKTTTVMPDAPRMAVSHSAPVSKIEAAAASQSTRGEKVPTSAIPKSKSSGSSGAGSQPSATPGLTRNDVMTIGMNPDIPIKALSQDAIDKILQSRKSRGASYGEQWYLEQKLKGLMAKDK